LKNNLSPSGNSRFFAMTSRLTTDIRVTPETAIMSDPRFERWETVGCDLCGSADYEKFIDSPATCNKAKLPLTLVRCLVCGLVYLNPRPRQDVIGEFYTSDYYAHSNMRSRQRRLRAKLRNRFLDGLGGYGASPDKKMIGWLAPRGLVDVIIPGNSRGKLLDVGCGDGERAYWYQERGFQAYGVETSERAVTSARELGVSVTLGTLSASHYPDAFFNVVVMAHVLEHTHSPREYLDESFRILKPGGILAVAVPNIASHSARIFKANWSFLMLPLHLYHFTPNSLSVYLQRSGFRVDSLVGKLVYPRMVRRSRQAQRAHESLLLAVGTWLRSGILPSALASLTGGVASCETITAYCIKSSETAEAKQEDTARVAD
jgi:2-polyprenyl-3-methyl-5-hydroxy-6-metoxy-1,4-benzoquinol methylase